MTRHFHTFKGQKRTCKSGPPRVLETNHYTARFRNSGVSWLPSHLVYWTNESWKTNEKLLESGNKPAEMAEVGHGSDFLKELYNPFCIGEVPDNTPELYGYCCIGHALRRVLFGR